MIFCILKVTEDFSTDPHPHSLVRGTYPRIRICNRIRNKMSRIQNTVNIIEKEGTGIQWARKVYAAVAEK